MSDYRFNWFELFRLLSPLFVLWLIPLYPDPWTINLYIGIPLVITHIILFIATLLWSDPTAYDGGKYNWWIKQPRRLK